MEEVWKDIEGFEGLYQVSDLGRVKSLDRIITYKDGRKYHYPEKILAAPLDSKGYPQVVLCKEGKRVTERVHVLVAKHFIGERPEGYDIKHIDGNKAKSAVSNLKYVTHKESTSCGTNRSHRDFSQRAIVDCCQDECKQHESYTRRWLDE